jgi:hypothetical protein
MTTDLQIEMAKQILASGLVTNVYHNSQLIRDQADSQLYPAYQVGEEFLYVGVDDTKGLFCYIRTNGDLAGLPLKVASCARSYDMNAPLRVVFFNDHEERNHEQLITQLSKLTFLTGVTLQRIITDKYRLAKEESPLGRIKLDGNTFYVAFDVLAHFVLLPSTCEPTPCIVHPNPITQCPAVANVSTSSATS